jgi:hypothetical protein
MKAKRPKSIEAKENENRLRGENEEASENWPAMSSVEIL